MLILRAKAYPYKCNLGELFEIGNKMTLWVNKLNKLVQYIKEDSISVDTITLKNFQFQPKEVLRAIRTELLIVHSSVYIYRILYNLKLIKSLNYTFKSLLSQSFSTQCFSKMYLFCLGTVYFIFSFYSQGIYRYVPYSV